MATITIDDLSPVGYSLLADDESYLQDLLVDDELSITGGGTTPVTSTTAGCVVATLVVTLVGSIAYSIYRTLQK